MRLLEALKFGRPQGLKGEIRASIFLQPENFHLLSALKDKNGKVFPEVKVKYFVEKNVYVVEIDNIDNRNMADELKHIVLYYDISALPELEEGEYYSYQLRGMEVYTKDNEWFGYVKNIHNFGASDILEIALVDDKGKDLGDSEMFSFSDEIFPEVDLAKKKIIIDKPIIL